jgi:hypothetical protein
MLFEGRQHPAVIERCWSTYLSITRILSVPENFHIEFPAMVESAVTSGTLQFTVAIGIDLKFILCEEYVFDRQRLTVARYSYNLMDASDRNVLRADNLPFHRTYYRTRSLGVHHTICMINETAFILSMETYMILSPALKSLSDRVN